MHKTVSGPRLAGPSNYHQRIKCLNTQEKQYGATQTQSPMTTMGKARSLCMSKTLSGRIGKVTYQVTWQHYTYHNSTTWNNWRIHCKNATFPPARMSLQGVTIISVNKVLPVCVF